MLILEGTFENGELHLDTPVAYTHAVRVRVEFLDDLGAAVRPPIITDSLERMRLLQASWEAARHILTPAPGISLSDEVVAAREEEKY